MEVLKNDGHREMRLRKAVFFDRDGVLNQAVVENGRPRPPADVRDMVITRGASGVMFELKELGFALICVTNQPDVARGTQTLANVKAINDRVKFELALDDLFVCLHDDADECSCRKPKPGLILSAAEKWNIDLPSSWMVGDRAGDVLAGRAAGCRTIFIDFGYAEAKADPPADYVCGSLVEAGRIIKKASLTHESHQRFKGEIVR
ncbi:MAG: HAD-IIIA family hydrolase [Deltaproteobacteria bacterium]|jgi:D-glycero-D-manno-heptose 1,7-bisphosphate phosphatase|nr:HAD-IIIA family hydrolase [Deltaproteobacteria bacterium]